jgi:hypothetical protein
MDSRVARPRAWREPCLAAGMAGAAAVLLALVGPPPEDAPAQLYRTLLARQGVWVWDNLWYGGHYPAPYGPLYGALAAMTGERPLVIGGAALSGALFALIVTREFGAAARWPARIFGLLAVAPLFTGLESYSLGLTALLGACLAAQARRLVTASFLSVVTLLLSPLAFGFLCIVLLAVRLAGRGSRRSTVLMTTGIAVAGGIGATLLTAFPNGGVYPFNAWDLASVLALCASTGALAAREPEGRPIAAIFAVWGLACLVAFAIPSPVGANVTRLRQAALPLALLAAVLVRFRPRWLACLVVCLAAANTLVPYLLQIPDEVDSRPAHAAFWAPTVRYLRRHLGVDYRVEVVPTAAHWEAYWIPLSGIPLARGWFRQLDPPFIYRQAFIAARYLEWLRQSGVRLVVVPHTALDPAGGAREASVVRSVPLSLHVVRRDATTTIYALRHPSPILTGPAAARLSAFSHQAIAGAVAAPGRYLLRVRYMPYWRLTGALCISRAPSGLTFLHARRGGPFLLDASQSVGSVVETLTDGTQGQGCSPTR